MDLFEKDLFKSKLTSLTAYHNFLLEELYESDGTDFEDTHKEWMGHFSKIKDLVVDSSKELNNLKLKQSNILFEGAQGSMCDIDQGTYPFVTSSSTLSGASSLGSIICPHWISMECWYHQSRCYQSWPSPFPTESDDDYGKHMAKSGGEVGATTGRPRRCGWLDLVALRKAAKIKSIAQLCITKIDVLDGLDKILVAEEYEN